MKAKWGWPSRALVSDGQVQERAASIIEKEFRCRHRQPPSLMTPCDISRLDDYVPLPQLTRVHMPAYICQHSFSETNPTVPTVSIVCQMSICTEFIEPALTEFIKFVDRVFSLGEVVLVSLDCL